MTIHKFSRKLNKVTATVYALLCMATLLLSSCQLPAEWPQTLTVESTSQAISQSPEPVATDLDQQVHALIDLHGLTGDPSMGRDLPSIESDLAQLGKKLFFTKALGGDMDVACASCHLPTLGGGDGLSLSIGTGAIDPDVVGPSRTHLSGHPNVPRNAPTTFNIALWDKVLFHDGRVESLGKTPGMNGGDDMGIRTPDSIFGIADPNAGDNLVIAQSRFPVTSQEEMLGEEFAADNRDNQAIRNQLAARLNGELDEVTNRYDATPLVNSAIWQQEFSTVFDALDGYADHPAYITEMRIAQALAAYERSQIFVDTPWSTYINGSYDAISEEAKRGAVLFYETIENGGANCASCHTGDFFTDEGFHVLAIPQVGPGKEDESESGADFGRFRQTRHPDDLYAFRTPSLLNVEVTGPYGHDGACTTLEAIVRYHLDPSTAMEEFDWYQLDSSIQIEYAFANTYDALDKLEQNRAMGIPTIENVSLTDSEIDDLIAFLHTLTDPCVKDENCLSPWMPEHEDMESFRLLAATQ
ncbi:MAG: cytochrome c peroxidase [Chloroflexota bacterium]